jgi:hypothetical protein
MIRTSSKLLVACVLSGLFGCSSGPTTTPSEQGEEITRADQSAPVIVEVVSRDTRITVRTGQSGPTYSVRDQHGEVIVPEMSLPTLEARHPELARRIGTMNASGVPEVWAGIE